MTTDERFHRLITLMGRHIRTEDSTRYACGDPKADGPHDEHDGFCGLDDVFGGEAVLAQVNKTVDGQITVVSDEGLEWPIWVTTSVMVRDHEGNYTQVFGPEPGED